MKIFYKYSLLSIIAIFTFLAVSGQQLKQNTFYMFNQAAYNPAYAGSHELVSANMLIRRQWAGIEGAPVTATISLHGPMKNEQMALGFTFAHDQLGVTKSDDITLQYAYRVPIKDAKLSFGLQSGLNVRRDNFSGVELENNTVFDEAFGQDEQHLFFNFGAGVFYYAPNFYVGVSVPYILSHQLRESQIINDDAVAKEFFHAYATFGYLLNLSKTVKLKPSLQLKYAKNAPLELDISLMVLVKERIWFGVTYRTGDSFDFLLAYQINTQFRLGYAYDLTLTELKKHTNGSHEVMIGYDFKYNRTKVLTPRYF